MSEYVTPETSRSDPGGLDALRESGAVRHSFVASDRHESNEHVALLYETQAEQFAVAVPFIRQGLQRGEKCLYVVDDNSRDDLIAALIADGIDVKAARETGALTVLTEETYVENGSFTPEDQLAFLADTIESATVEFPAVRVAVEMTCFLDEELSADDLVAYEERYNSLSEDVDATALCQYNRERFPAEILRDTIRAHPHLVVDGALSHNVYYTPPEDFFDAERASRDVDRMTSILADLAETETELKRKNERLEEFAGIVSHDLRNPLNIAEGHLELLREAHDDEHVEAIDRAHRRMRKLVDGLLTLAQQGDRVVDREPVTLDRLAEKCWENVETADARLRVETDRTIRADQGRLKRLFENLLRNAVEHGGGDVTVTVGDLGDDGFYLEDTGRGIPDEQRDQVFESGFSTAEAGTGFGLAIVDRIAAAHGWNIDVTKGEHGGARFEVRGLDSPE